MGGLGIALIDPGWMSLPKPQRTSSLGAEFWAECSSTSDSNRMLGLRFGHLKSGSQQNQQI